MHSLSANDFLDLWERGRTLQPLDRGLLMLGAALPEVQYEALADWPLGRRNAALAELQATCFGPNLQGQVSCPQCAENLEFQLVSQTLREGEREPVRAVAVRGYSFRLPTSRDLARAALETDTGMAAVRLIESCRMDAADTPEWRDEVLEEIGEGMSAADPLAEIRLTLTCAQCGHNWEETLDMVDFFWAEIESQARRILSDVHALAAAYGWSEKEILSLSEPRRRLYVEMVRA